MAEFARLLSDFSAAREIARQLATPNREDDDDIRLVIVGFSYHSVTENWSLQHYHFIRRRCLGELSDNDLSGHGDKRAVFRAFACLALGSLLGLYDAQQIDDSAFELGDALLPGFMYKNLPDIERLNGK